MKYFVATILILLLGFASEGQTQTCTSELTTGTTPSFAGVCSAINAATDGQVICLARGNNWSTSAQCSVSTDHSTRVTVCSSTSGSCSLSGAANARVTDSADTSAFLISGDGYRFQQIDVYGTNANNSTAWVFTTASSAVTLAGGVVDSYFQGAASQGDINGSAGPSNLHVGECGGDGHWVVWQNAPPAMPDGDRHGWYGGLHDSWFSVKTSHFTASRSNHVGTSHVLDIGGDNGIWNLGGDVNVTIECSEANVDQSDSLNMNGSLFKLNRGFGWIIRDNTLNILNGNSGISLISFASHGAGGTEGISGGGVNGAGAQIYRNKLNGGSLVFNEIGADLDIFNNILDMTHSGTGGNGLNRFYYENAASDDVAISNVRIFNNTVYRPASTGAGNSMLSSDNPPGGSTRTLPTNLSVFNNLAWDETGSDAVTIWSASKSGCGGYGTNGVNIKNNFVYSPNDTTPSIGSCSAANWDISGPTNSADGYATSPGLVSVTTGDFRLTSSGSRLYKNGTGNANSSTCPATDYAGNAQTSPCTVGAFSNIPQSLPDTCTMGPYGSAATGTCSSGCTTQTLSQLSTQINSATGGAVVCLRRGQTWVSGSGILLSTDHGTTPSNFVTVCASNGTACDNDSSGGDDPIVELNTISSFINGNPSGHGVTIAGGGGFTLKHLHLRGFDSQTGSADGTSAINAYNGHDITFVGGSAEKFWSFVRFQDSGTTSVSPMPNHFTFGSDCGNGRFEIYGTPTGYQSFTYDRGGTYGSSSDSTYRLNVHDWLANSPNGRSHVIDVAGNFSSGSDYSTNNAMPNGTQNLLVECSSFGPNIYDGTHVKLAFGNNATIRNNTFYDNDGIAMGSHGPSGTTDFGWNNAEIYGNLFLDLNNQFTEKISGNIGQNIHIYNNVAWSKKGNFTGGFIKVSCGGRSDGDQVLDNWNIHNNTYVISSIGDLGDQGGAILSTPHESCIWTLPTNFTLVNNLVVDIDNLNAASLFDFDNNDMVCNSFGTNGVNIHHNFGYAPNDTTPTRKDCSADDDWVRSGIVSTTSDGYLGDPGFVNMSGGDFHVGGSSRLATAQGSGAPGTTSCPATDFAGSPQTNPCTIGAYAVTSSSVPVKVPHGRPGGRGIKWSGIFNKGDSLEIPNSLSDCLAPGLCLPVPLVRGGDRCQM